MKEIQNIENIIRYRSSCRTYLDNEPIEEDELILVKEFLGSVGKGTFGNEFRFGIVSKDDNNSEKLGTYGAIHGAKSYIFGIAHQAPRVWEDYGYLFEKIILYCTQLGLGTCWLAGLFSRSEFAKAINLADGEFLPAVTPIGHTSSHRALMDSLIRFSAGAKKRKVWGDMFFKHFPGESLSEEEAGEYAFPLEMVRLAPSASNHQPWRIVRNNGYFHFFIEFTRFYIANFQRMDIGIAMCHFELSAREIGLKGRWVEQDKMLFNIPSGMEYIKTWEIE